MDFIMGRDDNDENRYPDTDELSYDQAKESTYQYTDPT